VLREIPEPKEYRVKLDPQETKVLMGHKVLKELRDQQDLKVLVEPLVHKVLKEHKVIVDHKGLRVR
jgi:hypothetical protein